MCKESPLGTLCTSNYKWFWQTVPELLRLEVELHFGWVLLTLYLPPTKSRFWLVRTCSRPETPLLGKLSCPTHRLSWSRPSFPVFSVFWPGEQKYWSKSGIFEGFSKSNKVWRLREDRISHFLRPTVNLPYQIWDMGQEEHPPIAQIQSWTFCFFVSTQISVHRWKANNLRIKLNIIRK